MIVDRRRVMLGLGLAAVPAGPSAMAEGILDLLRRPGSLAFMRHALAPIGEGIAPSEKGRRAETLGPCETQRNLNDVGRADARRIGELFRRGRIVFEHVYTSKWCRCRETAELIMGRPVENLPLINSYFSDPDKATKGPRQVAELKRHLATSLPRDARVLMVTHGSLIHDLAGFWTDESEIVVFKFDDAGDLRTNGRGVP